MDICQDIFETLAQYLFSPVPYSPFSPTLQSVVQRAATQRNDLRAKRKKIVLSLLLCAITETFTAYIRDLRQNTMKKGKASFSPVPYS